MARRRCRLTRARRGAACPLQPRVGHLRIDPAHEHRRGRGTECGRALARFDRDAVNTRIRRADRGAETAALRRERIRADALHASRRRRHAHVDRRVSTRQIRAIARDDLDGMPSPSPAPAAATHDRLGSVLRQPARRLRQNLRTEIPSAASSLATTLAVTASSVRADRARQRRARRAPRAASDREHARAGFAPPSGDIAASGGRPPLLSFASVAAELHTGCPTPRAGKTRSVR